MLGIYIHIPFCERKCTYCAFSSFAGQKGEIENYLTHLQSEITAFRLKNKQKYLDVDTIFIGGGTPSLLEENQIKNLFECLKNNFNIAQNCEITVECNPNSVTKEKLCCYKRLGVNRLSFGVQSFDDEQLQFIGRLHSSRQAKDIVCQAKECGFDNISIDLLIGINKNKTAFENTITTALTLPISHISTYMLQVEENTPLFKMVSENKDLLPDDEMCIEMYSYASEVLQKNGFNKYEVSNFAKDGKECLHNVKYWTGEEYVGFGLASHSYLGGERSANANNFKDYYAGKKSLVEVLTTKQKIEEHIMLGLRCNRGIDINVLKNFGYDIEKNTQMKTYIEKGILSQNENKIYLNPNFYGVNNFIIVSLLPE